MKAGNFCEPHQYFIAKVLFLELLQLPWPPFTAIANAGGKGWGLELEARILGAMEGREGDGAGP
jgi:hypothetical protein